MAPSLRFGRLFFIMFCIVGLAPNKVPWHVSQYIFLAISQLPFTQMKTSKVGDAHHVSRDRRNREDRWTNR